ncbi:hypothetical protein CFF01_18410 [Shewanella marisflavi]|uniref:Uncharacterized protein n=1 Tax=Shewanella marisflavi TaxID=260364 RepID=A0AAC9XQ05_9GAMM|nr:hypothetical protein CFF01_18410 [Shewanella marisflavi]
MVRKANALISIFLTVQKTVELLTAELKSKPNKDGLLGVKDDDMDCDVSRRPSTEAVVRKATGKEKKRLEDRKLK